MTVETVYQGADNANTVQFFKDGAAFDFTGVTRVVIQFREALIVADTDDDPAFVNWSTTPGSLIFKLGALVINPGIYSASIFLYDPAHTNGQVLVQAEDVDPLQFNFLPTAASTLIVQNDAGTVVNANSYNTVAEYLAYQRDRGRAVTADGQKISQALIRATDYLDMRFKFKGSKIFARDQTTQWPRDEAYDADGELIVGVPKEVKSALNEYTARALVQELAPDPTVDASGFAVQSKREKVGPLEETVYMTSGPGSQQTIIRAYPAADLLLKGLTRSGGNKVIRG